MSLEERQEAAVRAVLDAEPAPVVPAELCAEAMRRGGRARRRRRAALRLLWCVLVIAVVAFLVWATVDRPWVEPPSKTTPPLTGW
ncbi:MULTISPECIES: hypothetical protein [unclassified Streptomyces]|uniref:hypothetical protein n=1 Tax=unclassified Streptomyces TaxID=2593676 RepID=UPI00278C3723|nr:MULTISPECIES: hypothetical protein [unclassified Streptomyces]